MALKARKKKELETKTYKKIRLYVKKKYLNENKKIYNHRKKWVLIIIIFDKEKENVKKSWKKKD